MKDDYIWLLTSFLPLLCVGGRTCVGAPLVCVCGCVDVWADVCERASCVCGWMCGCVGGRVWARLLCVWVDVWMCGRTCVGAPLVCAWMCGWTCVGVPLVCTSMHVSSVRLYHFRQETVPICAIRTASQRLLKFGALYKLTITITILVYCTVQAGLLTPLAFARHRLSPLAAFTSGAYFLHNARR